MKRFAALVMLLVLCLTTIALGEENPPAAVFDPLPWEATEAVCLPKAECYLPDNGGYHDDSLDVRVETFRQHDTTVMAVYVKIAHPSQLRTATAATKYPSKRVMPVSKMLERAGGVVGINGDYFSYHSDGIVVRNGVTLRERPNKGRDTLIIDENGDFTILHPTSKDNYAAFDKKVIHAFCFGPGLVIDGEPLTDLKTVMLDCGKGRKTQRIVIGQTGPLEYLILTCEGPENKDSVGMDLLQMAQLCKDMGMINAYNLDGGSSCTVVLNNQKINALSSRKVRSVSDAIWFATLVP